MGVTNDMSQYGLALITICLIVTLGDQMSQFGLALIQAIELFISDISSTFWTFLGVDEQSVHFEVNCHSGRQSQWSKSTVDVPWWSKCH